MLQTGVTGQSFVNSKNGTEFNMYGVYDNCNKLIKAGFRDWRSAFQFKIIMSRYEWQIKTIKNENISQRNMWR